MDHLQLLSARRLLRSAAAFLIGLIVAVFAVPAMADYPAQKRYYASAQSCVPNAWSPAEACQAFWNGQTNCVVTSPGGQYYSNTDTVCYGGFSGPPGNDSNINFFYACRYGGSIVANNMCSGSPTCPAGQEYNATTNSCGVADCAPGQVRNSITNECQPPCPAAGAAGGSDYTSPYTVHPPSICRAGCALTVGGGFQIPSSTGTWYGVNGLVHTGEFCNGSVEGNGSGNQESYDEPGDPPPVTVTPEDDPPRCKAGECPGEVNGVYVCVPCGAAASETKPVKTFDRKTETTTTGTPPNDTTQTKTTDTVATHDGSGTVTSTTSTTTTTTGPNGTTTDKTTQEKKEPQESFCKDNPTSAFCKEGKWGGACGAFTCEGDAVQCALAREVHQRNCESTAPNALTDLADTAAAGTDAASAYIQAQKDAAPISAQAKFSESLQSSPIAATCPASRSIGLPGGYSVDVSFEKACEFAGYLGFFVQAFAYLSAALIVLRNPTA
ncbi:hypothetical protein NMQ14_01125 [Methyloversatilis sp. XJ19-13]|uniref:virulence factor TspB C-terminal domain-related protein n=1 Tax=Methyloversatilis sp. XJ19-13 TaxID=2963430 RepID=UPI00211BD771|nr:virulence factor TspB C-terminal domain-related protein [Methyloversatilis sp. XJ19-13]MCQ9372845.1 hypothetical protein [Methyloversatilis sp. XJ19-13]